ncbi:MAG: hypothetical protein IJP09_02970 [Clostridia bacterium]|nr:hypothetical protein [Clostridia bacterium]
MKMLKSAAKSRVFHSLTFNLLKFINFSYLAIRERALPKLQSLQNLDSTRVFHFFHRVFPK